MTTTTVRRALVRARDATRDAYTQVRGELLPLASLDLYSFTSSDDDISRFQITTDRVLGGKTDAMFHSKPYTTFRSGLFEGIINYTDDNPQSRGGFASVRTKADERVRDLSQFEGIEMRIKTDGRNYIANWKCQDYSIEHLWQTKLITLQPYTWVTLGLPFRDMVLTRRGRVEAHQFPINRNTINGFGILLADNRNGPFRFEIQWIRAVHQMNPDLYVSIPEQVMEETRQLTTNPKAVFSSTPSSLPSPSTSVSSSSSSSPSSTEPVSSSESGNNDTTNSRNNNHTTINPLSEREKILAAHRAKAQHAKIENPAKSKN